MGVLPRLKGRFAPMMGQNALLKKKKKKTTKKKKKKKSEFCNNVKNHLISRFKCYIYGQPCFLYQKSAYRIRSDNFLDNDKHISLRGRFVPL